MQMMIGNIQWELGVNVWQWAWVILIILSAACLVACSKVIKFYYSATICYITINRWFYIYIYTIALLGKEKKGINYIVKVRPFYCYLYRAFLLKIT